MKQIKNAIKKINGKIDVKYDKYSNDFRPLNAIDAKNCIFNN